MLRPAYEPDDFEDETPTNPDARELRPRVLVIEGDIALRELIVERMRDDAFDVVEAGSGAEALDLLACVSRHPTRDGAEDLDLVVIDAQVPGMPGIEVARRLRTAQWNTPVVLLANAPAPEVVAEAARLHLSLLEKPFAMERLSDTAIEALLAAQPCEAL